MSVTRTGHVTHLNAGDGTRPACGQRGALQYASVPDGVTCRHCWKWLRRRVLQRGGERRDMPSQTIDHRRV